MLPRHDIDLGPSKFASGLFIFRWRNYLIRILLLSLDHHPREIKQFSAKCLGSTNHGEHTSTPTPFHYPLLSLNLYLRAEKLKSHDLYKDMFNIADRFQSWWLLLGTTHHQTRVRLPHSRYTGGWHVGLCPMGFMILSVWVQYNTCHLMYQFTYHLAVSFPYHLSMYISLCHVRCKDKNYEI